MRPWVQDEVVDYKLAASEKMGEMEEGHSTAGAYTRPLFGST